MIFDLLMSRSFSKRPQESILFSAQGGGGNDLVSLGFHARCSSIELKYIYVLLISTTRIGASERSGKYCREFLTPHGARR
jgi:hypothetical protein